MNTLGERIIDIRKKNRLTQAEFGEQLGISQTHVSKIEKNIENPSETLLLFISYKFVVDIVWLKTGQENEEPESSHEGAMNVFRNAVYLFESQERGFSNGERWAAANAYYVFSKLMEAPALPDGVREAYYKDVNRIMLSLASLFRDLKELISDKNTKSAHKKAFTLKMSSENSINNVNNGIRNAIDNLIVNSGLNKEI